MAMPCQPRMRPGGGIVVGAFRYRQHLEGVADIVRGECQKRGNFEGRKNSDPALRTLPLTTPIHHRKLDQYLEPLDVLSGRKKGITRVTRNSKIFRAIVRAIASKKGVHTVSLDLRKIPEAVADFFIITEATSQPQIRAIADEVEAEVKKATGESPYHHEGKEHLQWVLIDYVNVVVHVMVPESRQFYKLEEMWSDAPMEEHND